ncbi:AAA family ATPase [Desulfatibacillum aliphaticivorans]|uniref:AAA family ATPase n=1 Tax=Desulfatibacillum aliphaticivorans TaxID=218208 RepID=UPI000428A254|nr:AAA family ATPase [Desulfatibacillum aliphaticivorans]
MLKHLRIKNFKLWKDTGDIQMAPITLLFGANSSGKSSISQLLMMLKQTVESPDRKAVLFPGDANSAVQLGSYKEMVHGRNPRNDIEFAYTWDLPEVLNIQDPISDEAFFVDVLGFNAKIGLKNSTQQTIFLESFNYALSFNERAVSSVGLLKKTGEDVEYNFFGRPSGGS